MSNENVGSPSSSGWRNWYADVTNMGSKTNVRAYIDLIDNDGQNFETHEKTNIIEEGQTTSFKIEFPAYNPSQYTVVGNAERTDRPHASFEIEADGDWEESGGPGSSAYIRLDASKSTSLDSSISTYSWQANNPHYSPLSEIEPKGWNIPDGKIVEFDLPEDYTSNIILTVTDAEGRKDSVGQLFPRGHFRE